MPRSSGVGAGGQPIGGIELEIPVDLVGEEMDAGLGTQLRSARHSAWVGSIPVGLCGALTTTSLVSGRSAAAQPLDVERPAVGLAQLVQGHVRAGRPATSYRLW